MNLYFFFLWKPLFFCFVLFLSFKKKIKNAWWKSSTVSIVVSYQFLPRVMSIWTDLLCFSLALLRLWWCCRWIRLGNLCHCLCSTFSFPFGMFNKSAAIYNISSFSCSFFLFFFFFISYCRSSVLLTPYSLAATTFNSFPFDSVSGRNVYSSCIQRQLVCTYIRNNKNLYTPDRLFTTYCVWVGMRRKRIRKKNVESGLCLD